LQRLGTAGLAALTVVGLLSGCSGKKKSASASTAAGSSAASAAAVPPTETASKVVATGGGKFCHQIANSLNSPALQAGATGVGAD